ncbi:hypothetical protein ACAG96_08570 [Candidatus Izemoplasma sp. B36]|uniref:hypothetical protein n=1 Tax=Candidatus Izemoplasma sp. B36 TaxID=3242468 RepID=UPI003558730C
MIVKVNSKKDLKRFIYFVKDLYLDDPHYIYPLFYVLYRELIKEVLKSKKYYAILSVDQNNKIRGRLLYTFEHNAKENMDICYWSYFDTYNDQLIANELLEQMEATMKENNVSVSEGSFTPYDPDNRRGVLVKGFEYDPVIFTSYNKAYYQELLEMYGFTKYKDTFSVMTEEAKYIKPRLDKFSKFFARRNNVRVDNIDFNNLEKEIKDIHSVLSEADHDIIYQETPSVDLIRDVAKNLKMFLDSRIIKIAREEETERPVGFAFCLLDYNQLFKRTKGRIKPLTLLFGKKKITKVRGMMQYIVPKYQGSGLNAHIYKYIYDDFKKMNINEFEAGTMMEGNERALTSFSKFGGEIAKTYRIYRKVIEK